MKVQLLIDGEVVATQVVSIESLSVKPSLSDVKRMALNAALEQRKIRISESLRATFWLFDADDQPVKDDHPDLRSSKGFRL